ncbi:MnhB domain-containing protein [Noviherbaspirillum sp.]|uniref:MnhB domain-containing protein n=1 Tax=Noviherbaspirillum sp. TaxID=1926288 RepID=UPI002D7813B1|nr:MnhB domain-containing protein [Noviherbaspirillum sp.]
MLVSVGCASLAGAAVFAVMALPEPAVRLAGPVEANMDRSGVTHPVTAVLLNFRGYDTLLEIAVLLLALLGVAAAGGSEKIGLRRLPSAPHAFLQSLTRLMAPLMVLAAGYLLWAGSHRPGGAFQAAAVLAAGIVLLFLAGLLPERLQSDRLLRVGMVAGFLVFLAVAAFPLAGGALLQYPVPLAGALILLIESGLTISLALILSGLFLRLPDEFEEEEE